MMSMNSGYSGWSMSKRAVAAYEDGEMPKSKWTKAAMLAAISEVLDDNDVELTEEQMRNLDKMPKALLFKLYFTATSWHHTSRYCNVTDFYAVDKSAVLDDVNKRFLPIFRVTSNGETVAEFSKRSAAIEFAKTNGCRPAPLGDNVWLGDGFSYTIWDDVK